LKTKGLLICYWLPPLNSAASHRTGAFLRHFNQTEDTVLDVLCPKREGKPIEGVRHIYTHREGSKVDYSHYQSNLSWFQQLKNWIIYDVLKLQFWFELKGGEFYKHGLKKISHMNMDQYDFVICSYGPFDVFRLGFEVKSRHPKINLILDYRDQLSLNPMRHLGFWKFFYALKEQNIINQASLIIGVSNNLVAALRKRFEIKCPTEVIYNGFDPDTPLLEKKSIVKKYIVHSGALYGGKRSCDEFLEYYQKELSDEFDLKFAIFNQEDLVYLKGLKAKYKLLNLEIKENLTYAESLELIFNSEFALLVLSKDGIDKEYLPVKMFEYIKFAKPIIFCGNKNRSEAYELINANNVGDLYNEFNFESSYKYNFDQSQLKFNRKIQSKKLENSIQNILNN